MKLVPIEYDDVFVGMKVLDEDPEFGAGVVVEIKDIHNILVDYIGDFDDNDINGKPCGLYCLDKTCEDYDPIYYPIKESRNRKLKRILK